jgi:hypothetical protein
MLRFRYFADVYDQLRMLAAAERDCYLFLVFGVTRADGPVVVRPTTAPNVTSTWRLSSMGWLLHQVVVRDSELGGAGRLGERGEKLPARADPELPVSA